MFRRIFYIFFLSLFLIVYVSSENLDYFSKFLDRFSKINSFKVNFTQKYLSSLTEEEESGVLYYKKPMKFCWKYEKPEKKEFLLLGRKTYFYIPSDSQVIISKVSESEFENSIFKIFENRNIREIEKSYRIIFLGEENGSYGYIFLPKNKLSDIESFIIYIDKNSYLPTKISIKNGSSRGNIFFFSDYKIDVKVKKSIFKPDFPEGIEKIYEE